MNRDEILEEINAIDNLLMEAQERLECLQGCIEDKDLNAVIDHTLYEVECARDEEWTDLVEEACGNR